MTIRNWRLDIEKVNTLKIMLSTRMVGHTNAILYGFTKEASVLIVAHEQERKHIWSILGHRTENILTLDEIERMRGYGGPILVDHNAICALLQTMLDAIAAQSEESNIRIQSLVSNVEKLKREVESLEKEIKQLEDNELNDKIATKIKYYNAEKGK